MEKVSVVITTFNEGKHLEACLKSIKNFADEIIIVDTGSTDDTLEIARKFTRTIFHHKNEGYVEPTRNFAIGKATNKWVLVLDADERISPTLIIKLKEAAEVGSIDVLEIPRKNIIFGKWIEYSGWWPDYQVRFFKKGHIIWDGHIHSQPRIIGEKKALEPKEDNAILHENYQSVSEFLYKSQRYSGVRAKELAQEGQPFQPVILITHPFQEFLSRYFAREGFRDGLHGFALSVLMAIDAFFVDLQVWELNGFKKDGVFHQTFIVSLSQMAKDLSYWMDTMKLAIEKKTLKKILLRTKRKLSL